MLCYAANNRNIARPAGKLGGLPQQNLAYVVALWESGQRDRYCDQLHVGRYRICIPKRDEPSEPSKPGLGPPSPLSNGYHVFFPGLKRPLRDADHSTPLLTNKWSNISPPLIRRLGLDMENFTLEVQCIYRNV